jgi:hypothetical protein
MWKTLQEDNKYKAVGQWRTGNFLLEWFQQMHSVNVLISRPTLHQKATDNAFSLKNRQFESLK